MLYLLLFIIFLSLSILNTLFIIIYFPFDSLHIYLLNLFCVFENIYYSILFFSDRRLGCSAVKIQRKKLLTDLTILFR